MTWNLAVTLLHTTKPSKPQPTKPTRKDRERFGDKVVTPDDVVQLLREQGEVSTANVACDLRTTAERAYRMLLAAEKAGRVSKRLEPKECGRAGGKAMWSVNAKVSGQPLADAPLD